MLSIPQSTHCSALIDLAIRCNWPSITVHSKLIFISVRNQRKHNAVCQRRDTIVPSLLKRTQGENQRWSWPSHAWVLGSSGPSPPPGKFLPLSQSPEAVISPASASARVQHCYLQWCKISDCKSLHSLKTFWTDHDSRALLLEEIKVYLLWEAHLEVHIMPRPGYF